MTTVCQTRQSSSVVAAPSREKGGRPYVQYSIMVSIRACADLPGDEAAPDSGPALGWHGRQEEGEHRVPAESQGESWRVTRRFSQFVEQLRVWKACSPHKHDALYREQHPHGQRMGG